jgi:hypothetical protein
MVLIKIDKSTIRENPDYTGISYSEEIAGRTIVNVSFQVWPDILIEGKNFFTTSTEHESMGVVITEGVVNDESMIDILLDKKYEDHNIKIDVDREHFTVTSCPAPKYLFEYKDTEIECNTCGGIFMSYDLKKIEISDEVYGICYTGCPLCGAAYCCNIEYEKFNLESF